MRLRTMVIGTLVLLTAASVGAHGRGRQPFRLNHTSWSFPDGSTKDVETIDARGHFIINTVAGKHVDHGTVVLKNHKACSTSAMDPAGGESCWTMPRYAVAVGRSFVATNEKGSKLRVTRLPYKALSVPK